MKSNLGDVDCALRVIIGLGFLSAYVFFPEASWRDFTLIGLWPLATALFFCCPVYTLLGRSTRDEGGPC